MTRTASILAAGAAVLGALTLASCIIPIPIILPRSSSSGGPNPKEVRIAPATLTGMAGDDVVAMLGAPDRKAGNPPDETWVYAAPSCVMELHLKDAHVAANAERLPDGNGTCRDPGAPMRAHLFHPGPGQHGLVPLPVLSSAEQARTTTQE